LAENDDQSERGGISQRRNPSLIGDKKGLRLRLTLPAGCESLSGTRGLGMKRSKVVLAKRSQTIDLEYTMFHIEKGKTYLDDGTTVFDVYIARAG
jgi:hypothetical protein